MPGVNGSCKRTRAATPAKGGKTTGMNPMLAVSAVLFLPLITILPPAGTEPFTQEFAEVHRANTFEA